MSRLYVGILVTVLGLTALISGTVAWRAKGPMTRTEFMYFVIAAISGTVCVGVMIGTAIAGVK